MGYSRSDTAHKWAHQLKERVAYSDNLWAEGTRLYSYRTVIGQIFFFKNGNRCYIIQNGSFSSSTSKHQGYMNSAIPGNYLKLPLYVDRGTNWEWSGFGCCPKCNEVTPEKTQMSFLFDQAIDLLQAIEKYKDDKTLNSEKENLVIRIWNNMQMFCEISGEVSISKVINTKNADWRCEAHDWYRELKKERVNKMRKALRCLKAGMTTEQVVDAVLGVGTYQAYIERTAKIRKGLATYRANAENRRAERERVAALSEKERILEKLPEPLRTEISDRIEAGDRSVYRDLYHLGYINNIPYHYSDNSDIYRGGNVLMRLHNGIVETSKGMKVTIDECKRLWKLICRWHENQNSFTSGERAITQGYSDSGWKIRAYLHDVLHAGCHSISYEEMRDLAIELKLIAA